MSSMLWETNATSLYWELREDSEDNEDRCATIRQVTESTIDVDAGTKCQYRGKTEILFYAGMIDIDLWAVDWKCLIYPFVYVGVLLEGLTCVVLKLLSSLPIINYSMLL